MNQIQFQMLVLIVVFSLCSFSDSGRIEEVAKMGICRDVSSITFSRHCSCCTKKHKERMNGLSLFEMDDKSECKLLKKEVHGKE